MALRNITFKKTNVGGSSDNYFISIDSPRTLLVSNITRAQLEAGYTINNVDVIHTVFIVSSTGVCINTTYVTIPYTAPPADTTLPSTPTNLSGTGQGLNISLIWVASTDNVGVTGYEVFRDDILIGTTSTADYNDLNVFSNTNYTYKIRAYDAAGNLSAFSSPATINSGEPW